MSTEVRKCYSSSIMVSSSWHTDL